MKKYLLITLIISISLLIFFLLKASNINSSSQKYFNKKYISEREPFNPSEFKKGFFNKNIKSDSIKIGTMKIKIVGGNYLKLKVSVILDYKPSFKSSEETSNLIQSIKSIISLIVSQKTKYSLLSINGKTNLKKELSIVIAQETGFFVKEVLFEEFFVY